jgi:hypothetical protein
LEGAGERNMALVPHINSLTQERKGERGGANSIPYSTLCVGQYYPYSFSNINTLNELWWFPVEKNEQ